MLCACGIFTVLTQHGTFVMLAGLAYGVKYGLIRKFDVGGL